MQRREFTTHLLRGAALTAMGPLMLNSTSMKKKIRPKALFPGARVGLVAPSSSIDDERLEKAIRNIESLSLKVEYSPEIMSQNGYLAGTDEVRLQDFHRQWQRKDIDAIWCIRGGYGCARLLPQIDYKMIRKNPKLFIGYSDITALNIAIQQQTGLTTFHGPVAVSDLTDYNREQIQQVLFTNSNRQTIVNTDTAPIQVIHPGKARGTLIGGNLSLLSALIGTPYAPKIKGKLLLIEEIREAPYRIDRMLTQLRQALPLKKAAGIILGTFANCEAKPGDKSLTLMECLRNRLGDLGIPVIYGFSFGHIDDQFPWPVGVEASFDTDQQQLIIEEQIFAE